MKKVIVIIFLIILLIGSFYICRNFIVTKKNNDNNETNLAYESNEIINEDVSNNDNNIIINENTDDFVWETSNPIDFNVDTKAIDNFNNSIANTEITSSIIVKNGKIINEYYKDGYNKESIFPIHSCSKSITSSLIGIAIDKGYIESVDVSAQNFIPEIQSKDITIRHLLTNTSGIESVEDEWYEWRASENWTQYILNKSMVSKPGKTFSYSTGNTHLLSVIMQKATGKTLYEFGKENLFDKIGMKSIKCEEDGQGITDGGNGYTLTARDMARFGMLYSQNGLWQGSQVVPQNWVQDSTSLQFKRNTGTADYGYQWWVRTFGKNKYKSYFAQGFGCQFIFVVPEINLVVTFTSNYNNDNNTSMYWKYMNNIVNACNK